MYGAGAGAITGRAQWIGPVAGWIGALHAARRAVPVCRRGVRSKLSSNTTFLTLWCYRGSESAVMMREAHRRAQAFGLLGKAKRAACASGANHRCWSASLPLSLGRVLMPRACNISALAPLILGCLGGILTMLHGGWAGRVLPARVPGACPVYSRWWHVRECEPASCRESAPSLLHILFVTIGHHHDPALTDRKAVRHCRCLAVRCCCLGRTGLGARQFGTQIALKARPNIWASSRWAAPFGCSRVALRVKCLPRLRRPA